MTDFLALWASNVLWVIILAPLMAAFLAGTVSKFNEKSVFWIAFMGVIASAMSVLLLAWEVVPGGVIARSLAFELGEGTSFTLAGTAIPFRILLVADSFTFLMAIIVALGSIIAMLFSYRFITQRTTQFYILFCVLIAGTYGMVLTGDLFNLFVFLEILSISAAGLIMTFDRKRAPDSAFKFLIISTLAALMILVGIGLLYSQYDALNMALLAKLIRWTILDKIALSLIFVGLAMKAGAVPMHFWVPDAYGDSPAAVSAFFVVASQASLYALFRVCFSLFGLSVNHVTVGWALVILGVLSMFVGVMMALVQKDIKRLMAFHAISQTGYMLLGVGVGLTVLGTPAFTAFGFKAMEGGIFHILNHAIYKGLLFLTAGAIFYVTGTRNLSKMGGLAHHMPLTTVFFLIGAFAIAGLPPFSGFASKILIYESVYLFNPVLSAIALLVSILTLASFMKVFYAAFLGPKPKKVRKVPTTMLAAMFLLSLLTVLFGLFPNLVVDALITPAVMALTDAGAYVGVIG